MDVTKSARVAEISLLACGILTAFTGCAGLLSQVFYAGQGQTVPAVYDDLSEKRTAVVCVAAGSSAGTGSEAQLLTREVSNLLRQNVKDIELVRQDEIADWIDREGWDEIDYREIGRGVKAERVIAIDMQDFRLYEGTALYHGRSHVTVTVYDMTEKGKEVFRKTLPEVRFPMTGPYPVGDTSEATFRREYLRYLGRHVAKFFHRYDLMDDFGSDPAIIGS